MQVKVRNRERKKNENYESEWQKSECEKIGMREIAIFPIGNQKEKISPISNPDAGHHHCRSKTRPSRTDCWDEQSEYVGTVSTTVSGRTCQNWAENTPHVPRYHAGHHNYCRNPDNDSKGPWCYTTDQRKRFEYCSIPAC